MADLYRGQSVGGRDERFGWTGRALRYEPEMTSGRIQSCPRYHNIGPGEIFRPPTIEGQGAELVDRAPRFRDENATTVGRPVDDSRLLIKGAMQCTLARTVRRDDMDLRCECPRHWIVTLQEGDPLTIGGEIRPGLAGS